MNEQDPSITPDRIKAAGEASHNSSPARPRLESRGFAAQPSPCAGGEGQFLAGAGWERLLAKSLAPVVPSGSPAASPGQVLVSSVPAEVQRACSQLCLLGLKPAVRLCSTLHRQGCDCSLLPSAYVEISLCFFSTESLQLLPQKRLLDASFPPWCLTQCFNRKGHVKKHRGMTGEFPHHIFCHFCWLTTMVLQGFAMSPLS